LTRLDDPGAVLGAAGGSLLGVEHDEVASAVASLRAKYDTIAALRDAYDRTGGVVDRAAVAALAARWPGAVRELDTLSPAVLTARREALRGDAVPAWVVWLDAWHRTMAAALWVKARVRRDDPYDPTRDAALGVEAATRAGMALGEGFVAAVRRPEGGRLAGVVSAVVTGRYGPRPATLISG